MENEKNWYQSKAVWGALVAIGASLAQYGGVDLGMSDQGQVVESVTAITGAIGGLVALYGRITAKKALK